MTRVPCERRTRNVASREPPPTLMADAPLPPLDRIVETALYCDDLSRSRAFYIDILGFEPLLESARLLAVSVGGNSELLLFQRGATNVPLAAAGGIVPPPRGTAIPDIGVAGDDRHQVVPSA